MSLQIKSGNNLHGEPYCGLLKSKYWFFMMLPHFFVVRHS